MESNAIQITDIDWRALLATEVSSNPRGKAGVADRLGVTRGYVSQVMSEGSSKPAAVSPKFVKRVLGLLHVITCPATREEQPREACAKAIAAAPTHNPQAMRVWRCCQTCPHKPTSQEVA